MMIIMMLNTIKIDTVMMVTINSKDDEMMMIEKIITTLTTIAISSLFRAIFYLHISQKWIIELESSCFN